MNCQANPDRLTFDDQLNDYVPNPFDVVTQAINVGETRAENCQLVFVGPPRFSPVDNTSIINVGAGGVMNPGDTISYTWRLVPLKRSVGGWDTLVYQIQGRGGMGNRLLIGECRVPIYVPPARAAEYKMVCTAPDRLTFDNAGGVYIPDPFTLTAQVTNNGLAEGQDLEVTAQLPPDMIFANGETATKVIGNLAVNAWVDVKWLVRPTANLTGADISYKLCAQVKDRFGRTGECCSNVIVPPATKATLGLTCATEYDTLRVDRQRGTYEDNPFVVTVKITNNGDRPASNVKVVVLPQSNELRVLGDPERYVAKTLDPKVTTDTLMWNIYAVPRSESSWIDIRFVVTADGLTSQQCIAPIYVPEVGKPMLRCYTESSVKNTNDTLFFNWNVGGYTDDNNQKDLFTVTSYIFNDGAAQANRVKATLLPPEGIVLDVGETASKELGDLLVQGQTRVSWNVRPIRQKTDALRTFSVQLNSDNALQQKCTQDVYVKGAPKESTVRLPEDRVGQYGEKILVPIFVDPTIGKDMFVYKLNVQFDEALVRFVDAISTNTVTERGWTGPRAQLYAAKGTNRTNIVRVEDYTTGTPLNTKSEEVLVILVFEAVLGGQSDQMLDARTGALTFLRSFETEQGSNLYSSINSVDETEGNDVSLTFIDGAITVSGDCIVPLTAAEGYMLTQNKPNPFNPTTTIEYTLPEETDVSLTVFDQLGRQVMTLVKAHQNAGRYSVVFDGGNLASGNYVYRLETPKFTKTLHMILAR
jgi:hypothetical protein